MKSIVSAILFLCASFPLASLAASSLPYDQAPPGETVQTANFNFIGSKTTGLYVAVLSRRPLAANGNPKPQYQPYLTIYRQDAQSGTLSQIYQSPSASDSLNLIPKRELVSKAHGLWLPGAEVSIVGTGQLMEPNTQQLVVSVYAYAADCGGVTIHVLRLDPASKKLQDALKIENFCKLDGSIAGHSLLLSGPYYARNAALCCPTKNDAQATAGFDVASKQWIIAPSYFKIVPAGQVSLVDSTIAGGVQPQTVITSSVVRAAPGEVFAITLPSNPTTGYSWQLDKHATTPSLTMVSSRYEPPATQRMGAPGEEAFTFKAPSSGYALLGLRYLRPFDKASVPPAKEAFFVVVVR